MVLGFIMQPIHTLQNFQAPNVAAVMNSTTQIIRNGYPIQLIASKFLFYTSLHPNSVISYTSQNSF